MIDGDALVEFTRELVRIPSVYDPARRLNEQPAAEAVEAQMRAFGWSPSIVAITLARTPELPSSAARVRNSITVAAFVAA